MKRFYFLLFYKLKSFFKALWDDDWVEWKALTVISVTQAILFVEGALWISIIWKKIIRFSHPALVFISLFLLIEIFNYLILLRNDNWKKYFEEFEKYPKVKRRLSSFIVFLFFLGVLTSLIWAFYEVSQIDWKQYR